MDRLNVESELAPKRARAPGLLEPASGRESVSVQPTEPRLPRATPQSMTLLVIGCSRVIEVAKLIGSPLSILSLASLRSVKHRVRVATKNDR